MDTIFRNFLNKFLNAWKSSSISDLQNLISENYKAREITKGVFADFGYEESLSGWEQGFKFAKEQNAQWILNEHAIIPLRTDENMVIISATMMIDGQCLDTGNLFFDTFKQEPLGEWKLSRSYIEAGVTIDFKNNIEIY